MKSLAAISIYAITLALLIGILLPNGVAGVLGIILMIGYALIAYRVATDDELESK